MIRIAVLLAASTLALSPISALAQASARAHGVAHKKAVSKTDATNAKKAAPKTGGSKPELVGSFGAWNAYVASGKNPTCYALAKPDHRVPDGLKRDPAYVFISTRPAEHVRNEISIVMGFEVKNDDAEPAKASVGRTSFDMIAKGSDLWLKQDDQDAAMLAAMKKGDKLVVKAASLRGKVTTDSYSLTGLSQALDHAQKGCK
jgi:hypothetical protein